MFRRIFMVMFLLAPVPDFAQQPTPPPQQPSFSQETSLPQQVDSAVSEGTTVLVNMGARIKQQAARIEGLEKQIQAQAAQIATLMKGKDEPKPEAPK